MEKAEQEQYEDDMEEASSCHVMDFQFNCPHNRGNDDCSFVSFEKVENGQTAGFTAEGCAKLGYKRLAGVNGCISQVEEQYDKY